jgi:nucleotide-binding universal stress UspA family protein
MNCPQFCPLSKLNKLLLATDRSEYSEGAIREAISFAKKCSSMLYAMSVVEIITDYEAFSTQKIEDALEANAIKHLESIKERALKEGVKCETIITHGNEPYKDIVDEAEKRRIDMIIIGRHSRRGLEKVLMSEVAAKVIGHAPCKVLVVPRASKIEFKKLLVATDGSAHSEKAVAETIGIAKCCDSNLLVLSAMRDVSEQKEAQTNISKAEEIARKEGVNVETLTPVGRSYDVIVETAGGRGVDLIVMGTYGKTGLKKFLMGSSTEKVIGNAGCAVLVVKGEEIKPATV